MRIPFQHRDQSYEVAPTISNGIAYSFLIRCPCGVVGYGGNHHDLRLPPDAVHQIFRKLGWIVGTRRARSNRCPECQLHPESSKERQAMSVSSTVTGIPTISQTVAVASVLDHYFDAKAGRFTDGWNDERVSAETKVPRALVIKIREEGPWGELKGDPELEAIKADVGAVSTMLRDIEARLQAMERREPRLKFGG